MDACVVFRVGRADTLSVYKEGIADLDSVVAWLEQAQNDESIIIEQVGFFGAASPEGSLQVNRKLSRKRLESVEQYVRSRVDIPDSIVFRDDACIPWHWLREEVSASDIDYKDEILEVIDSPEELVNLWEGYTIDNRVLRLQKLRGGKPWKLLLNRFFGPMRLACVWVLTDRDLGPISPDVTQPELFVASTSVLDDLSQLASAQILEPEAEPFTRRLFIKTNAIAWAMMVSNIAVEVELTPRWSLSVPAYYSAMNYFTSTLKFRILGIQPEARYWAGARRNVYVGAHAAVFSFNYALNGDYRIQDHNRHTPGWGGGVSAGWRTSLGQNDKWFMELTAGVGAYKVHYDKFLNESNGQKVGEEKKTFFGVDNLAVTFSYKFDLKRKKR